jgi:hypothetical protein
MFVLNGAGYPQLDLLHPGSSHNICLFASVMRLCEEPSLPDAEGKQRTIPSPTETRGPTPHQNLRPLKSRMVDLNPEA